MRPKNKQRLIITPISVDAMIPRETKARFLERIGSRMPAPHRASPIFATPILTSSPHLAFSAMPRARADGQFSAVRLFILKRVASSTLGTDDVEFTARRRAPKLFKASPPLEL